MDQIISLSALGVSTIAVVVAALSWRASERNNRATIFEQRLLIYSDVAEFIRIWAQHGQPDMGTPLKRLVEAWERSQLLFDTEITAFIRRLWLDSIEANMASMTISNQAPGNRSAAVEKKFALQQKYCMEEMPHLHLFKKHMRI